jgi:hypothetical protein
MTMQRHISQARTVAQAFLDIVRNNPLGLAQADTFPRNIEEMLLYSLEIPVQYKVNLSLHAAEHYICALRQIPFTLSDDIPDRPLLGLLHVGSPSNLILIKDGLPNHTRNYVLAHELGHFLTDIFIVRNLWLRTLPEQTDQILKAFTWQEYDEWVELQALIKGLPPRARAIVSRGRATLPETTKKEFAADLIARELLAPWEKALKIYRTSKTKTDFIWTIHTNFGLPPKVAHFYYEDIKQNTSSPRDFFSHLFSPLLDSDAK